MKMNNFNFNNLKLFIDSGFSVEMANRDTRTLLHTVCMMPNKNLAQKKKLSDLTFLLIANKANVHFQNSCDLSSLQLSQIRNSSVFEVINHFIQHGTVWSKERHFSFPFFWRQKIFLFLLCLRLFSKCLSFPFPKPLVAVIVHFASIDIQEQPKRKVPDGDNEDTNKQHIDKRRKRGKK